ncbi:vascular endothelial growth factor D isoform X2 [Carettochelys insculpta]|uniref:vascular endothelial growth factor D isoform X2 n=1 Tax=Carettochelys insculpta TaxID=44489 RepID=UPI003EB70BC6
MYKPWATLNIFIVSFLHLLQGSDYDYGPMKRASLSALERSEQLIRKAASLEELLRITHSEDWKLWKCRLKLKSLSPLDSRSTSHRSTRFAAAFYDIETLRVIDEEWQKTQCMPRETCVEVAKELGTTTNKFFKPPCVNVFRCGGCCNEESLACMNTSTTYVSKTDSLLLQSWLSVGHIWNLMKITVSVPVDGNAPAIFFKIKRTAAAICVGRARRVALRDTRFFMQRPAAVRTSAHPNPECAQLRDPCVQSIVVVQRRREFLMRHRAKKILDLASALSPNNTLLCKVAVTDFLIVSKRGTSSTLITEECIHFAFIY